MENQIVNKDHTLQSNNLGSFEIYINVIKMAIVFFVFYAMIYIFFEEYPLAIVCTICTIANASMLLMKRSYFPYFILTEHILVSFLACAAVYRLSWNCGTQYLLPMAISLGFFVPFKNDNIVTIINILETFLFIGLYLLFHDVNTVYNPNIEPYVQFIHVTSIITCSACVIVGTRMTSVANAFKNLKMKNANEELATLANQDGLTQLYNRRAVLEILENTWQESQVNNTGFWIIMFDIDYFKEINDTSGHDAGDNALIAVATALQSGLRSSDYISRWGGDEFMVVINHKISPESISKIIKTIQANVKNIEHEKLGLSKPITLTIGATSSTGKDSIAQILVSVDECMYEGKRQGRNIAIIN